MSHQEAEMIDRCQQGDAKAWQELFDLHYAATGRFLQQVSPTLSREDIDELCQEVFLTVIRHLNGFKGQSHLQTWIFRIAVNKARDLAERQRAAKRGGGQAPLSLNAEDSETGLNIDPPSSAPGPDGALLNSERMNSVRQCLERLEDPCREVIELRYFGDLAYEEIAAALNLNVKTVSSRLSKCLDKLEGLLRQAMGRENSQRISV